MPKAVLALLLVLTACVPPIRPQDDPPFSSRVDAVLGPRQHGGPAGVALGSTGKRLWCHRLEPKPGMLGRFHYLHLDGLSSSLFGLELSENGRTILFPPLAHQWWPSHTGMEGRGDGIRILERKLITADDRAVDLVRITNEGDGPRTLRARVRTPLPVGNDLRGRGLEHGVPFSYSLAATGFRPSSESRTVHAAYNPERNSEVQPTASFAPDTASLWGPLDGGARRWTSWSSGNASDWYEIRFRQEREIHRVALGITDDEAGVRPPAEVRLQYEKGGVLADLPETRRAPTAGRNEIAFEAVKTSRLRIVFAHRPGTYSGLTELEVWPGVTKAVPLLERELRLGPHDSADMTIEMSFENAPRLGEPEEVLERHLAEHQGWFEKNVPDFDCSDAWFTKLWYYRWFMVRRCLAEPRAGRLTVPCFFAGRSLEEHAQVDPAATALQIREARWLRDPAPARGHLRALFDSQFEGREGFYDGQLAVVRIDRRIDRYGAEWAAAAPWELDLVHPDVRSLESLLPRAERNLRGTLERLDSDRDSLVAIVPNEPGAHRYAGMPFQPSFFWFNPSRSDSSRDVSLERVDYACFVYAGLLSLESAGIATGGLPAQVREAVCRKMWNPDRRFFYSLKAESDRPALVEEIGGFYPHAFRLVPRGDRRYDAVFERLFDPEQFWAPVPILTASRRSEFFSPDAPGGRHANGPTWLAANAIVLEAVANAIKAYRIPSVSKARFFDLLHRYTRMQFSGGDFSKPHAGEVLHPESGETKTAAEDYFGSTYADLLIRHVGGLTPRSDAVFEFDPIVEAFPWFRFRNVPYRGSVLEILWDAPDGRDRYGDGIEGFTVKRNGKLLFTTPSLRHVEWSEKGGLRFPE